MSLKYRIVNNICDMGGFRVARLLTRHCPRVLMYHRFCEQTSGNRLSMALFDQQMMELKKNFNVQHLSVLCDYIRQGKSTPPHSIALTIDDGYDDFYHYAFPILKKHGLPATIYITSDFIDRKLWLWPDLITYILKQTGSKSLTFTRKDYRVEHLPLETGSDRSLAWTVLNNYCLSLGNEERLKFIRALSQDLAVTIRDEPEPDYGPMSWSAVRELSENGIEIGAHSRTHPVLSKLDRDQLREEIGGSKKRIEQFISLPVTAFCYPNGQPADYNDLVKQVVIECGFSSATVAFYDRKGWQDLFEIRRFGVAQNMVQFRKALYGVEYLSGSNI